MNDIIGRYKSMGIALDALVRGMLVDQLGDNFSIKQVSEWLNRKEILEHYGIRAFNSKTLYRAVETLGRNRERIIRKLQNVVLELLGRPETDVLLDWTSIVYYVDMAKLAKFGSQEGAGADLCVPAGIGEGKQGPGAPPADAGEEDLPMRVNHVNPPFSSQKGVLASKLSGGTGMLIP